MEKRIPVIIPAYEPDEKMIRLLQTLQESGIERIVVVDDGSGNEYRNLFEQAKQLGAIVLTHAVNLGKGRALKTAFNEVLNRYLKELDCTARKLSIESGLTGSVICRYRSGERTPIKNSEQYEKSLDVPWLSVL